MIRVPFYQEVIDISKLTRFAFKKIGEFGGDREPEKMKEKIVQIVALFYFDKYRGRYSLHPYMR
jgi:hypothetical protein